MARRLNEHNGCAKGRDTRGAAYTRARRPVVPVYGETYTSRAEASKREWVVKRLSRLDKLRLVDSWQPDGDSTIIEQLSA